MGLTAFHRRRRCPEFWKVVSFGEYRTSCLVVLVIVTVSLFVSTDSSDVRKEIADETDRETGRSKQISTQFQFISVYSPQMV
ncbi:unnamed protein product [Rhodiola kirilowii]